jgi:hypothetical protein
LRIMARARWSQTAMLAQTMYNAWSTKPIRDADTLNPYSDKFGMKSPQYKQLPMTLDEVIPVMKKAWGGGGAT